MPVWRGAALRACSLRSGHIERGVMRGKRAFTLVELLVVIGIIAVLVAMLLPALRGANEQAMRVMCMNNHKQLILAVRTYAHDNRDVLPFVNSNASETGGGWTKAGWLYWHARVNADGGFRDEKQVETGLLWQYLRNTKIYRCPFETPPYRPASSNLLTSYCVNLSLKNPQTHASYKLSQFKSGDILFWEADETKEIWNDGCNNPGEGITARHGGARFRAYMGGKAAKAAGAIVGCIGGHAEWLTVSQFDEEAAKRPGRVQCGPNYR